MASQENYAVCHVPFFHLARVEKVQHGEYQTLFLKENLDATENVKHSLEKKKSTREL